MHVSEQRERKKKTLWWVVSVIAHFEFIAMCAPRREVGAAAACFPA